MKTLYRCTKCSRVFGANQEDAKYRLTCPHCDNVMETPTTLEEEVALQKEAEGLKVPPSSSSSGSALHRKFVRSTVAIIAISLLGMVLLYFLVVFLGRMRTSM